ncbi:type I secretion system permease/ATPase [Synechococcus sp. HB1133]|uniref:type I secretion system permease/ATPase n=1 Tax=unclassified Synechococcus TaxID=2626047 RepID=UPI00140A3072|nr:MULTISPECIES: peptidase domain-containing ABC transporter [unclassified Synechococcus]MCB4393872.1 type I secretion system permease/ATPase [Synechococcus sp. PH41509]MCB4421352.1 type I secretion system permease/ATPase [Synechococcus sp. HB1133]MCB4431297.1 type I secretion system permease/ATPase [Synechococcus sp. HBA1120]NHI80294.1 type I secretion system permease/ATPase [Synechococcus sp. HB1133]
MTQTPSFPLLEHPAFRGVSDVSASRLESCSNVLRFELGGQLCDPNDIPARILVILRGQARLVGRNNGRLTTVGKFGPGSVIGAASHLCGAPCENVIAAEEVIACALSDELWRELYSSELSFRNWCDQQLWPQELLKLLEALEQNNPETESSALEKLESALHSAERCAPNSTAVDAALAAGKRLYVTSAWGDLSVGQPVRSFADMPSCEPFSLRLVALPSIEASALEPRDESDPEKALTPFESIQDAEILPPVSSYSPERNVVDGLRLIRADGSLQETLACFQMLAQLMKLPFRRDSIEKVLQDNLRRGLTPNLQLCGQLAASLGLHVMAARVPAGAGTRLQVPSMLPWKRGFALVIASNERGLKLASPRQGMVTLAPDDLAEQFPDGIELLLMERSNSTPDQKFGPGWFWPALKRYRGVLIQVLSASFVVQLFTLANPLLIQVIIDKVITQRSLDTLQVLGIALVVVTILEGVLGSLKTFLFAETTNRIDQRLGAEVIDHLLRLPLGYFDRRPVGELGTRVAELEKIRNFLTGQALTTILDAAFSVIYIAVMLIYSWLLTLIALSVLPIQIGLTILGAPLFRRQFRAAAEENAKTQSHLVEVLTGIQTVKAQNVEMVSRWRWQGFYSQYIARTFEKTITGTALNQTSQVLQKISQLMVLWIGASMVLSGDLTLGQLIAFRIISGYVTQPLLRLSTIWQNIQELRVSFERLADVIDTPEESDEVDKSKVMLPPLQGDVRFENLSFRFRPGQPQVLKDVNLEIPAGTFVGIVGQSGSGKSTLMKLLPRLYDPENGRILIDGYDIGKVELYSLRRQIGIVPQDPLLFSGTVSDNIALTNPEASSEEIVRAARLANAHDFIMDLPSGYSTPVGERGAALSGGQRQRVAIARTLLSNPRLLVMDEATSALDYETERKVCDNLLDNLNDRTVFFITHRLSTIRKADVIVMLHQGAVVEVGTHDDLMTHRGRYFALYRQQESS